MTHLQSISPGRCAEMLMESTSAIAFTDAGISTAAGIPDFRGPEGLYATGKYDADKVFEIEYFRRHPELFYHFSLDFLRSIREIKPTFTHFFLAKLESSGRLHGIITQNIDALHHVAGSQQIAELHGSYWSASCLNCDQFVKDHLSIDWWENKMIQSVFFPVVHCPHCQGVIKPHVVFFGEPVRDMELAQNMILQTDLLLVLGSSLTVYPAAFLPQMTEAPVIIVNKGPVRIQSSFNRYFVDSDLDEFFRNVDEYID